ncbi:hypothetical protein BGX34_007458 [Mortierella sp. NVP85]|nr:hypothetical protein BGX34_007458 [Mortierella sp. NVP85]
MNHPVKEISSVIHRLTQGSPAEQKHALETYFTPDATFQHPFCRVSSFSDISVPIVGTINSRWVILMIYRWYKIISPSIALEVHSAALYPVYDQQQQVIYAQVSQVFNPWFVPFYKPHVRLVTVLHLKRSLDDKINSNKYYIQKQEDQYQFNEFIKFVCPFGDLILAFWQMVVTIFCIGGALLLAPLTWLEQEVADKSV